MVAIVIPTKVLETKNYKPEDLTIVEGDAKNGYEKLKFEPDTKIDLSREIVEETHEVNVTIWGSEWIGYNLGKYSTQDDAKQAFDEFAVALEKYPLVIEKPCSARILYNSVFLE